MYEHLKEEQKESTDLFTCFVDNVSDATDCKLPIIVVYQKAETIHCDLGYHLRVITRL